MFKAISSVLTLACLSLAAQAQPFETAQVISATPVLTQVPHQVCDPTIVASAGPKSGAGALVGAIAGGVVGNAMGRGSGNAATTALGVMGGAMLGDKVEGEPSVVRSTPSCAPQLMQVTVYQVEYELNGKRYTTQMAQDPGKTLSVQVAPAVPPAPPMAPVYAQPPVYAQIGRAHV